VKPNVESYWNRCKFDAKSKWDQREIVVSSTWHRSDLEVEPTPLWTLNWNRSEIQVTPKWDRSAKQLRYKWNQIDTELKSKRFQYVIEVKSNRIRRGIERNRSEIPPPPPILISNFSWLDVYMWTDRAIGVTRYMQLSNTPPVPFLVRFFLTVASLIPFLETYTYVYVSNAWRDIVLHKHSLLYSFVEMFVNTCSMIWLKHLPTVCENMCRGAIKQRHVTWWCSYLQHIPWTCGVLIIYTTVTSTLCSTIENKECTMWFGITFPKHVNF
jgi:hypothetical protein